MTPLLWQNTPFRHPEGLPDFLGQHDRWHAALAKAATAHTGLPMAEVRLDDLEHLGDTHQRMHEELAAAWELTLTSDFSLYDIAQREGWVLFMQLHALEHQRLRLAAEI